MKDTPVHSAAVLSELRRLGILLESDALLPSVAGIVAGGPIRGSWWGHPRGRDIFAVSCRLAEHPDLVVVKLVSGKLTWVHRKLWSALMGVATSGEPWQRRGLAAPARMVLSTIKKEGEVRTDRIDRGRAAASKILEERLLVRGEEVHTESGAHARVLQTWERWARRARFTGRPMAPDSARRAFEEIVHHLNATHCAKAFLPWER